MANWISACQHEVIEQEGVLRFDHGGKTYAIYRSPEDEVFCTAGLLAEGVESLPRSGETGLVSSVRMATGGDAINEVIALAKLGNRVELMGLVGDGALGLFIRERCARQAVGAGAGLKDLPQVEAFLATQSP